MENAPTEPPVHSGIRGGGRNPDGSIDPRRTDYCYPDSKGNYVKEVTIAGKGHNEDKEHDFAFGGGCVFRPLAEVWASLRDARVMKWEGIDEITVVPRANPPDGAVYLLEASYVEHRVFDVKWTMNWIHSSPSKDAVWINYGKIRGTSHIRHWQGGIVLDYISDGVTAVTMQDTIDATQTGPDDCEGSIRDVIGKLRD